MLSRWHMLDDSLSTDLRAWHLAHVAAQAHYDARATDSVRAGIRRRWRGAPSRPKGMTSGRTPDGHRTMCSRAPREEFPSTQSSDETETAGRFSQRDDVEPET